MEQSTRSARPRPFLRRASLALLLAGGVAAPSSAFADGFQSNPWANYGQNPPVVIRQQRSNVVFRGLDSFAGGIEKLFGLGRSDSCCDEIGCDDACDAAMMDELYLPEGQTIPMPAIQRWETLPGTDQRLIPAPSSAGTVVPEQPRTVPSRRQPQQPLDNGTMDGQDEESIFEGLGDPFEDDQAGSKTHRASIRPSSYRRPAKISAGRDQRPTSSRRSSRRSSSR